MELVRPHLASLVDDLRRNAHDAAIVVHRGNRRYFTTYGELAQLAGRFAAELDRRNVAPGDRVILWGANSAAWLAALYGCLLRGVIAVPLDAASTPTFAQRVIADTTPKLILSDQFLETSTASLPLTTLGTHLPQQPNFIVSEAVTLDAPFQIIFTSGTTSEPKGIVHTHRNVLASVAPIEREMQKYLRYERFFHPLRFLHTLPLSHVFGQFMGVWLPPLLAAEVHFLDQLEPRRIAGLLPRERISVLITVPRILQLLQTHLLSRFPNLPQQIATSQGLNIYKRWWHFREIHRSLGWRFWAVISGGATLPPDLEAFYNRLGLALIQGYGMTETTALVTLNHPFKIGKGTIGKALPGREVRITDEGEMQVRGDMLSSNTWRNGQMTAREDDWLSTGDLAAMDDFGEIRFLGRKGDVIVTAAGMNIHPADLEAALAAQPGIRAAAVVPCEALTGIEPVAVVLFSGSDTELQSVTQAANSTFAPYQQIRRVLRWPHLEFPYTSTGKLLRRSLADWACQTIASKAPTTTASQDALIGLITTITGETAPSSGDDLRLSEDLHLDSLGRVQLQSELEQSLGIDLDDDQLSKAQTLRDLRALISTQSSACKISAIQSMAIKRSASELSIFERSAPEQSGVPRVRTLGPGSTQEAGLTGEPAAPKDPAREVYHYPRWPWLAPIRLARMAFIELLMRPLIWLLAAPRVTRPAQPLPDAPLLLISNHVTAYDGALILYALPPNLRRRVAVAMSGEMLLDLRHGRNQGNTILSLLAPIGYWLITALFNVFPLPRTHGFRASFDHAGDAMDHGYSVLIFPEGTRSRDGQLHPFRSGIGLLAQESDVPVLPTALVGLHEMRSTGLRRNRIEVRVGDPIPRNPKAQPVERTANFEKSVLDLLS
jgi:long-chain acyl-CoA synthetase